ncbi:hypothetical protein GE061_013023 [Apolygus lucorum]|uniref:Uncharacterized protein n=1 Tax=Apolygus lucorum TaxID=248454 RepID=A0A6A4JC18_APOLU|nr:hypothetical protein GE061_013023 [Apolygus lucorum]
MFGLKSTSLALLLLANSVSSLKCYQCNSTNLDKEPKCDRLYWKQMSTKERDDLIIDCLERLSYFCIVIRKLAKDVHVTTRGCMGTKDSQGTTLSAGCVDVSDFEKACLCTDNLCNSTPAPHNSVWMLFALSFLSCSVFSTLRS